jgi:DNA-binding LacI/PurR family transcriptional regulator
MVGNLQIKLKEPEPVYRQVASELRDLILTGKLQPGEKLPKIQTLAKQWNSNYFTVQSAIAILVKEGLLKSQPRVGTFVRQAKQKLKCIGVYYGRDFWASRETGFYRQLHCAIQKRLAKEKIQLLSWIDERSEKDQATPLPELKRALLHHEIQGLIVPLSTEADEEWLPRVSVPISVMSTSKMATCIGFDDEQFLRLGLKSLAKQGCRNIGFISVLQRIPQRPDGSLHPYETYYRNLESIAKELNLNLRQEWMKYPLATQNVGGRFEQFGYRAFCELWESKTHPDGVLVYPDVVAWGVIVAILEKKIQVPKELKLAFHQNPGIDYLCPFPATYIAANPAEAADAFFEMIRDQHQGKTVKSRKVSFSVSAPEIHIDKTN